MAEGRLTEQELISRVQQNELDAYTELMEMHVGRLRAFVALNSPTAQLIDEVAHDTFVYAFFHIAEFQKGSFYSWLKAIAWNLLRAEIQRFSREQANKSNYAMFRSIEADRETAAPVRPHELEFLEICLRRLNSRMRNLLEAKYIHGWSAKEIADQLQQTEAKIKTTVFRLRKQLRRCIENQTALNPHD